MRMTFLEAMEALADRDTGCAMVRRPNGPIFTVNHLGQMTAHNDCLYVGDVLDLNDWTVEEVADDLSLDSASDAFSAKRDHASAVAYLTVAAGYAADEMIGGAELETIRRATMAYVNAEALDELLAGMPSLGEPETVTIDYLNSPVTVMVSTVDLFGRRYTRVSADDAATLHFEGEIPGAEAARRYVEGD